jgi:small subunit ribosomal protein S9
VFQVNRRKMEEYFPDEALKIVVKQPLLVTETAEKFDVNVFTLGGGISGQAEAIRLGLSRALLQFNVELRKKLKEAGFLTRDARVKERKKYGQPGARKKFQFSKR